MLFIALLMIIFRILDRYRDREERQAERAEDREQRQAELKAFQESINKMSQDNLKAFKEYLDRDSSRADKGTGLAARNTETSKSIDIMKTDAEIDELVNATFNTTGKFKDISARIQKNIETIEDIANSSKKLSKNARDIHKAANKFKQ